LKALFARQALTCPISYPEECTDGETCVRLARPTHFYYNRSHSSIRSSRPPFFH
jgi:hypothetical protein